jgi:hypothetical protein
MQFFALESLVIVPEQPDYPPPAALVRQRDAAAAAAATAAAATATATAAATAAATATPTQPEYPPPRWCLGKGKKPKGSVGRWLTANPY